MVLPHYPRKIKYLKNVLKITIEKDKFLCDWKKKFVLIIQGYIYSAVKYPGQSTVTTGKQC